MAKPHKYAWTGVDVETTLSFEQLANMAERAAQQSTGDLTHGRYRVVSTRSNERRIEFLINDYLISYKKCMVFHLDFAQRDGRTWMTSRIDWYEAERPKIIGLPAGGKAMVAHHTYMQFATSLAGQVRAADSRARVTVREGSRPKRPAASEPGGHGAVGPKPAAPPSPAYPRPTMPYSRPASQVPRPSVPLPGEPPSTPSATGPAPITPPDLQSVMPASPSVSPPGAPAWKLRLPDGELVPVASAVVLGRNPALPLLLRRRSRCNSRISGCRCPRRTRCFRYVTVTCGSPISTRPTGRDRRIPTVASSTCEPGTPDPVPEGWQLGFGEFLVRILRV